MGDPELFLVERYLPGVAIGDVARSAERTREVAGRMSVEGRRVRYLGSTFVPEDESCLCLFEGTSAADVEEANRLASFPFERIVAAVRLGEVAR